MSPLSEQFSESRNSQLEAQFEFFRNFTGKAFESVEKIIALNFDASRATLEKSSEAMRQMVAAKDPRDLLAFSTGPQAQLDSMLAYSRRLFDIATSVPPLFNSASVAAAPAAEPAAAAAPSEAQPAPAPEPAAVAKPVAVTEPAPPAAKSKAIAKAVGKLAAKPDVLPHPSAAPFPTAATTKQITLAQVKPVEATPPHAPVSGTPEVVSKKAAAAAVKPARKK